MAIKMVDAVDSHGNRLRVPASWIGHKTLGKGLKLAGKNKPEPTGKPAEAAKGAK